MNNLLSEVPIGFGMALAGNLDAMTYFANLNEDKKQQVISQTTEIRSKNEMQQFVSSLSNNGSFK